MAYAAEPTPETAPERCAALATQAGADTVVTATRVVAEAAPLPEYCLVEGYVVTPGVDGGSDNQVGFRVGLPTKWNRDLYFQGVGGLAGSIGSLDLGLQRGYASASTDTGHTGGGADGTWAYNNPTKRLDYAYRATHVVTVAAKQLISSFYQERPRYSILNGCSNGGRQGLMEAQRYPDDYDGVISRDPAMSATGIVTNWIYQIQAQLAEEGGWLSPDDLNKVAAVSLKYNDARDGLTDGLISDPERATLNGSMLAKTGLSAAKIRTALAIHAGLTTAQHEQVVLGKPIGHQTGWPTYLTGSTAPVQGPDGTLDYPYGPGMPRAEMQTNEFLRYFIFDDPTYKVTQFDLSRDLGALRERLKPADATNPDLRPFADRGGRLLLLQGWADPAVDARMLVDYYKSVTRTLGAAKSDQTARLFMMAGTYHCAGGHGMGNVDSLTAMEKWLRDGQAPETILAATADGRRTRPLCQYPAQAIYVGHGNVDDAASYRCSSSQ
ncbi:tannase/feruloyl esterase family alpha/beta hydrolase [Micromonospora sp. NPDC050495]|uniref:tannase/feruloyl esterase family alpha/beta hydrolase n=1 Tax=Micromonospora sp. NPDC050495 TaxID=3154936 RepID=UPI0033D15DBF